MKNNKKIEFGCYDNGHGIRGKDIKNRLALFVLTGKLSDNTDGPLENAEEYEPAFLDLLSFRRQRRFKIFNGTNTMERLQAEAEDALLVTRRANLGARYFQSTDFRSE